MNEMISIKDAAEILGVSSDCIYAWEKKGKLSIQYLNKKDRRVSKEVVLELKEQQIPEGMKKCNDCGLIDTEDKFVDHRFYCKECFSAKQKDRYHRDKDKYKAKKIEYGLKNKERINQKTRKWYKENREKAIARENKRYHDNKEEISVQRQLKKYNLTIEEFENMKEAADNKCEICGKCSEKMCVDHCHSTLKVRGLLCPTCNSGLGFLGDKAESLEKALNYLKNFEQEDDFCGYFYAN